MNVNNEIETLCNQLKETLLAKNSDYGSAVFYPPILNQSISADSAIIVRLSDKFNRLTTLLNGKEQKVFSESIRDTLFDIAGYSLLYVIYLEIEAQKQFNGGVIS